MDFPGFGVFVSFSHFATNLVLRILGVARLFFFLISQSIKQSIKWYLAKGKNPLTTQLNGRHDL